MKETIMFLPLCIVWFRQQAITCSLIPVSFACNEMTTLLNFRHVALISAFVYRAQKSLVTLISAEYRGMKTK